MGNQVEFLRYFGLDLPVNQEWEIFGDSQGANLEHGFMVCVDYRDGTRRFYKNITEVHYKHGNGKDVAFESDIHCTGVNTPIYKIQSIEVGSCDKLYEWI